MSEHNVGPGPADSISVTPGLIREIEQDLLRGVDDQPWFPWRWFTWRMWLRNPLTTWTERRAAREFRRDFAPYVHELERQGELVPFIRSYIEHLPPELTNYVDEVPVAPDSAELWDALVAEFEAIEVEAIERAGRSDHDD